MAPARGPRSANNTPKKRSGSPDITPRHQSKRPSRSASAKGTPNKSVYREIDSDEESEPAVAHEESGYEDEDESAVPDEESEESEEVDSEADDRPAKGRGRGKQVGKANSGSGAKSKNDLWREGVKVDGDGEVFIALPRARSPGKTPYQEDTLHPNTFLFLKDLKKNNDREWLRLHDKDFRQSEKDWFSFVEALTEKLIEKDETIPELPYKDVVFRIYRDVRFSPDKTPYKTHFSAAFSRTGRKGPYACYYVQISPGSSLVGGGLWCPDADPLGILRTSIDQQSPRWKRMLLNPGIRKQFLGGVPKDEQKAVKAFCKHNSENALKRHPKGYDETHPEIEMLRLRNFVLSKRLKDEEVVGPKGMDNIVEILGAMEPFVTYLNSIVMPDPNQDNSSDNDDADDD